MEAYSRQMAVAVRRAIREADSARFAHLLAYYRQRGGPGLALIEAEQLLRQQRQHLNHSPQAA
ncbi:hypothetical protein QMK33_19830 [Hymenobacter sp. H14-R3]|uniref:hypothetical protein n=1 Tax=Hymenobacter sp. H14-R3 TaxID=3046308 RepID=UPI0024B9A7B5|nr:hypothetical protein [Hymenobacter sp. H14-R3]MDJ0367405.1 hypothetical protein [Hymenobacter sp. H14-R3]